MQWGRQLLGGVDSVCICFEPSYATPHTPVLLPQAVLQGPRPAKTPAGRLLSTQQSDHMLLLLLPQPPPACSYGWPPGSLRGSTRTAGEPTAHNAHCVNTRLLSCVSPFSGPEFEAQQTHKTVTEAECHHVPCHIILAAAVLCACACVSALCACACVSDLCACVSGGGLSMQDGGVYDTHQGPTGHQGTAAGPVSSSSRSNELMRHAAIAAAAAGHAAGPLSSWQRCTVSLQAVCVLQLCDHTCDRTPAPLGGENTSSRSSTAELQEMC
jgi:hypothetical protein